MRLIPEDDFGSIVFDLTAARLQPGTALLVEVARRRWVAPGFSWHGQPLVRAVATRYATSTTVRRIERESTLLSGGTATEIIVWTDHGVLVCTPSTVPAQPQTQLTETSIQDPDG